MYSVGLIHKGNAPILMVNPPDMSHIFKKMSYIICHQSYMCIWNLLPQVTIIKVSSDDTVITSFGCDDFRNTSNGNCNLSSVPTLLSSRCTRFKGVVHVLYNIDLSGLSFA